MDDDADGDAGGDVDADGDSGCLEHGNDNDGDLLLPVRRRCSDAEGGAWGVWRGRKSARRAADPAPARGQRIHAAASPRGEVIRGEDGAAGAASGGAPCGVRSGHAQSPRRRHSAGTSTTAACQRSNRHATWRIQNGVARSRGEGRKAM
ncbi:hypothetical protein B0H13DRAFT_1855582 [Mycena leptocephala]|nr:hypothetical protein B0H13DRAFT_1855582 [Mycena leptocephala]